MHSQQCKMIFWRQYAHLFRSALSKFRSSKQIFPRTIAQLECRRVKINRAIASFLFHDFLRVHQVASSDQKIDVAVWPERQLRIQTRHRPTLNEDRFDTTRAQSTKN